MIDDCAIAKRWKAPLGAGSETTSGRRRAATVNSRGARASTDRRRAAFRLTVRNRLAWTPTFFPRTWPGLALRVQKCFVPARSLI